MNLEFAAREDKFQEVYGDLKSARDLFSAIEAGRTFDLTDFNAIKH